MPVIQELSPHLADLIAAGEVVERPASVAKELIENAIDAGASRITVEMENGGISYLRIADDGCGMTHEDAPIAFRRHATSKLRHEEDLNAIHTLGFRGEALAAISAVSHIDLFTKTADAIAGTHLFINAGEIHTNEEAGCPPGTTIIVRDLFFNTPARMKFLKKDFTEAGYVLAVIQHAALSHPEISFICIRDGKQTFQSDGKGKLLSPVFSVFGKDMTADMIEVPENEHENIKVYGYITKPHAGRANRSLQHFFVNGRYIKSKLIMAALEQAYKNAIITGKYPSGAVFLQVPYESVDVNVHPAKTEVKFSNEKQVFEAVYIACKNAIALHDNTPTLHHEEKQNPTRVCEDTITNNQRKFVIDHTKSVENKSHITSASLQEKAKTQENDSLDAEPSLDELMVPIAGQQPQRNAFIAAAPRQNVAPRPGIHTVNPALVADIHGEEVSQSLSEFQHMQPRSTDGKITKSISSSKTVEGIDTGARVIGECFQTYLIAEDEDGLILIDKHAAHERILFNEMKTYVEIPMQQLLTPVVTELSPEEFTALKSNLAAVKSAGFDADIFGEDSIVVRAIPAYLDAGNTNSVMTELAEKIASSRLVEPDALDDLIHTTACKAAIKAGKASSMLELQEICNRVISDPELRACPHGRPTMVRLTKYELDKMFKRVNQ